MHSRGRSSDHTSRMHERMNLIRKSQAIAFLTATAMGSGATLALMPALDESILCGGNYVVIGRVLDVAPPEDLDRPECHQPWNCEKMGMDYPRCQNGWHSVRLQIKVLKILATEDNWKPGYRINAAKISVGETTDVAIVVQNDVCLKFQDSQGRIGINPPANGSSPADSLSIKVLRREFVGKKFVLSIGAIQRSPYNRQFLGPNDSYRASAWRFDRLSWATHALESARGENCPKLIGWRFFGPR